MYNHNLFVILLGGRFLSAAKQTALWNGGRTRFIERQKM